MEFMVWTHCTVWAHATANADLTDVRAARLAFLAILVEISDRLRVTLLRCLIASAHADSARTQLRTAAARARWRWLRLMNRGSHHVVTWVTPPVSHLFASQARLADHFM